MALFFAQGWLAELVSRMTGLSPTILSKWELIPGDRPKAAFLS
ncbi:MAG: hypothetical protein ACI861_000299 [Paracoccaceae bacterium]|jgi:hypothetical protein